MTGLRRLAGFGWPRRHPPVSPVLAAALSPNEQILLATPVVGGLLAATRFGLWLVGSTAAARWDWDRISKARLSARTLTVIATEQLAVTDDGTVVLVDSAPYELELSAPSGLTDVVHHRVRRSVAASRHLAWPGGGGWVVLRRVPGRDGLTRQVRLDPGADFTAAGFLPAVAAVATELEGPLSSID